MAMKREKYETGDYARVLSYNVNQIFNDLILLFLKTNRSTLKPKRMSMEHQFIPLFKSIHVCCFRQIKKLRMRKNVTWSLKPMEMIYNLRIEPS